MTTRTPQAVQAAATRSQLVAVGRRLFAERGFAGTSTEEIVTHAGVTRGALYYHFSNKVELFRAVLTEMEEAINERVTAAAMAEPDMWDGLLAGCAAFLDVTRDPSIQRIALLDAPSVLGWDAWREVGSRQRFEVLALSLQWVIRAGEMADHPVIPLVHVLLGALNEGALYIARATDQGAARDEVVAIINHLLSGLRP